MNHSILKPSRKGEIGPSPSIPAGTDNEPAGKLGEDVPPMFRRTYSKRAKSLAERIEIVMANYWPDDNGCWNWRGATNQHGYPHAMSMQNGKKVLLRPHRLAYERAKGAIPPGLMICHKCDNRRCINPEHLFAGTADDNVQDMVRKKRNRWGNRHGAKCPRPSYWKDALDR